MLPGFQRCLGSPVGSLSTSKAVTFRCVRAYPSCWGPDAFQRNAFEFVFFPEFFPLQIFFPTHVSVPFRLVLLHVFSLFASVFLCLHHVFEDVVASWFTCWTHVFSCCGCDLFHCVLPITSNDLSLSLLSPFYFSPFLLLLSLSFSLLLVPFTARSANRALTQAPKACGHCACQRPPQIPKPVRWLALLTLALQARKSCPNPLRDRLSPTP